MIKHTLVFILLAATFSCKENMEKKEAHKPVDSKGISQLNVVNEKDPVCDMDVKNHLSDTALIGGQIWGFCSIVCKEKYLQENASK